MSRTLAQFTVRSATKDCSRAIYMWVSAFRSPGVAHQNGTSALVTMPRLQRLTSTAKTHDVDNLYVVDGSFFPSSAAVNPALTIIANALRVGDHLLQRMGVTAAAYEATRTSPPKWKL